MNDAPIGAFRRSCTCIAALGIPTSRRAFHGRSTTRRPLGLQGTRGWRCAGHALPTSSPPPMLRNLAWCMAVSPMLT